MGKTKKVKVVPYDTVGNIMAYEAGGLDNYSIVELFVQLGNSGMIYQLQGSYGRGMNSLIEQGHISIVNQTIVNGRLVAPKYKNNFPKPLTNE